MGTVKRIPQLPQTHRFERLQVGGDPRLEVRERMEEEAGRSAKAGSRWFLGEEPQSYVNVVGSQEDF